MRQHRRSGSYLKNRLIYGGFLLGALLYSLFMPDSASRFLLLAALLLPLFSLLLSLIYYYRFRYYQRASRTVLQKGEDLILTLQFENPDWIHYHPLEVSYYAQDLLESTGHFPNRIELPPGEASVHKNQLKCLCRGIYSVGIKHLRMKDYLGLYHLTFHQTEDLVIKVFPRQLLLKTFPLQAPITDRGSRDFSWNEPHPAEWHDFRIYQPGDSPRRIHWKKSAQGTDIYVRREEIHTLRTARLFLDLRRGKGKLNSALLNEDRLIEALLAIGRYLLVHNYRLELYNSNGHTAVYKGLEDATRLYNDYALISFREGEQELDFNPPRDNGETPILIFSCSETSEMIGITEELGRGPREKMLIHSTERSPVSPAGFSFGLRILSLLPNSSLTAVLEGDTL